jgi:lysophospholipase L1-like esterase
MGVLERLTRRRSSVRGPAASATVRRLATSSLVAALAISLGLNVFLARAALDYVRTAAAIRLDPGGLQVYAGDDRGQRPEDRPLLVLFGDSRAAMWTEPASTDYRIVNHGVGYQTTAQLLLREEADVLRLHPAVVVLEAGVNDLNAIAEFPSRRAEIVSNCEANLSLLVKRCEAGGARVVLVTVFDIGDVAAWRRPFWSEDVRDAVREVNAFLPRLVGGKVVLFDANPVLHNGQERFPGAYQVDYLHLTPAAYAQLNRSLSPLLSALPR